MRRALMLTALVAVGMQETTTQSDARAKGQTGVEGSKAAGKVTELRLAARLSKYAVSRREPIVVSLELRSQGVETIVLRDDKNSDVDFQLTVRRDGRAVPMTRYGTYVSQGGFEQGARGMKIRVTDSKFVTLKKGQHKQYVLAASKIYDMTRRGTYVLTIARQLVPMKFVTSSSKREAMSILTTQNDAPSSAKGTIRLISNTVTVTVK